jgi:serine protease AprX
MAREPLKTFYCFFCMHSIANRSLFYGITICVAIIFNICIPGFAQTKKVIFLKDKNLSPFSLTDPEAYLSERAIARRSKYNIPYDSTDLPVNPQYVQQISALNNLRIVGSSKWLNALIIECDDANSVLQLNNFQFVQSTVDVALKAAQRTQQKWNDENIRKSDSRPFVAARQSAETLNYGASAAQIMIHNGQVLHQLGAKGEGMMMAFMDAGYNQYQNNRFLQSANDAQRVIARDFYVQDNDVNDHPHGLLCLSAVAASIPGEYTGSCPNAKYLLLRTEDAGSEQIIEEYMWALGAEYADSCGADVISASVGYTTFDNPNQNHTYQELDGNTTIVTRMADLAAKKGMLIVTSAGNEGASNWKYIGAPADADSVLSVGAIDLQKQIAGFSSFGLSADGSVKPDIVSVGYATALIGTNESVIFGSGTSFSTPNIAGLITCLWQLFPDLNNQQIMEIIRQSSDRYTNPDVRYGYGIPDMARAVGLILQKKIKSTLKISACKANISWSSYDKKGIGYLLQKKHEGFSDYFTIDTIYSNMQNWGQHPYSYNDELETADIIYRIVQIFQPGISNQQSLPLDSLRIDQIPESCKINNIRLFPNPVKNQLNILIPNIQDNTTYLVNIFNAAGNKIKTMEWIKTEGSARISNISLAGMSKGIYTVEVLHQKKRLHTGKIIIE